MLSSSDFVWLHRLRKDGTMWRLSSSIAAIVLVIAAVSKGRSLNPPFDSATTFGSLILITLEIVIATWLLSLMKARIARHVAVFLFSSFGTFNLVQLYSGSQSCGCFGRSDISPWETLLLDLCLAGTLYYSKPAHAYTARYSWTLCWNCILLTAVLFFSTIAPTSAETFKGFSEDPISGHVIVEPGEWIGNRLPLFHTDDVPQMLNFGRWQLVFYRNDCSQCQELLKSLSTGDHSFTNLALVDLSTPEAKPHQGSHEREFLRLRIRQSDRWILRTPLIVDLNDGIVTHVQKPLEK